MKKKEEFFGYENHDYNPIIRPQSQDLLVSLLKKNKPKQILEIGTFIGYSCALMLETCPDAFVTTIEKGKQNYEYAIKNLEDLGFMGRYKAINCDAMDFLMQDKNSKFDLIFLDGPKGQYYKYLPYLKEMLCKGGILVVDDVMFYGLVQSDGKIAHKHRSIVNNLRKFLDMLKNDTDFDTQIFEFEDGVSVSRKLK